VADKRIHIPGAKACIPAEDIEAILADYREILETGQLAWGKQNDRLEVDFAAFVGVRHAVSANSGASALELALRALDVRGREVIVPTNTNYASAGAVVLAGGTPVFCDTDAGTLSPRVDQIRERISPKTAGIMIVHLGGIMTPELPSILAFAKREGYFVIEDASHAHSSTLNGRKAGTFSDVSAFSMFATKVITMGEGGLITTDSETIHDLCKSLRNQGKNPGNNDVHHLMGSTYRVAEFQAVLGIYQLRRNREFRERRHRIARRYDQALASMPHISAFPIPQGVESSYYKYIAWLDPEVDRDRLWARLRERYDIHLTALIYRVPCHKQPVFRGRFPSGPGFPEAEHFCDNHLCLPMSAAMTPREQDYVIEALSELLTNDTDILR
jgi:perosamine synthetase